MYFLLEYQIIEVAHGLLGIDLLLFLMYHLHLKSHPVSNLWKPL